MFIIILSIIIILLAALVYWRFRPKMGLHRFFYAAIAFLLLEIGLYLLALSFLAEPLRSYLDIRYSEYNHSATFSSLLLFISAISSLSIAFHKRRSWVSLYFLLLSFCFLFLAVDEYFMIHETLPNWEVNYALTALIMAALGIWVFITTKPQDGFAIYLALFGGIILAASGGVVAEWFYEDGCFGFLHSSVCSHVPLLEEILETLGFAFTAAAALALARTNHKHQPYIGIFSGAWLAFLIFSTWFQPALEAGFFAQRTSLQFEESSISLTAYRLNLDSFRPGDSFSLDLYWQSSANLEHSYGYTVNLLDPLTGESLWRENLAIAYPATKAWFPGITYRSHYDVIVPDYLDTPVSPILTVALWRREGKSYQNFAGLSVSLPIFAEQFPIVDRISILSPIEEFSAAYRFANGILIAEPELVHESEVEYRLNLVWSSEANITESLGYFIHFLGEGGQENLIFDQQPFENRFPTNAWRLGMVERDELALRLPADASGSYRVQMGLYDGTNRLPVSDLAGNPVLESSIQLGIVSIP